MSSQETKNSTLEDRLEVSGVRRISTYEKIKRINEVADEVKELRMKDSLFYKMWYTSAAYIKNLFK